MEALMDTDYRNIKRRKVAASKNDAKQALKRPAKSIEVKQKKVGLPGVSDNCQESLSETILKQLENFKFRGFEVTNCIFKKKKVEICYILDDSMSIDNEDLKQRLISHLGMEGDTLKLTQLRERPLYQETSIQPGDRINIDRTQSQCCVGAFVKVQDKGIHVLMPGHGKQKGDVLCLQNGNQLGKVVVSLTPPQRISKKEETVFRDISLGQLDCQVDYNSTVATNDGISIQLNEDPAEAEDDMDVRLFINGERRGKIESTRYVKMDQLLKINHRFISVKNEQGEPVHNEGESGLLIVKEPETLQHGGVEENKVTAVGMLISRETISPVNANVEITSLAVPLTTGFKALSNDTYCGGADVKFC